MVCIHHRRHSQYFFLFIIFSVFVVVVVAALLSFLSLNNRVHYGNHHRPHDLIWHNNSGGNSDDDDDDDDDRGGAVVVTAAEVMTATYLLSIPKTNRFSYSSYICLTVANYPRASDGGASQSSRLCLAKMWHFPCNPELQSQHIRRACNIHILERETEMKF